MDIEQENLAAHVGICQQRYLRLEQRLDNLETKLSEIASQLVLIRSEMLSFRSGQERRWWGLAVSSIGLLLAMLGWFLSRSML